MSSPRPTLNRRVRSRLYPGDTHPFQHYSREVNRYAVTAERILDVGCGHTAPDLEAIDTTCCKVGVDLDPHLRPSAAPSVEFVRATSETLPFAEGTFDLVICKSVLEHLDTPESAFREIGRVLRRGGHAVLLTPNRWDYVSMLSTLVPNRLHPWVVRMTTGRAEEDTFPTRYRANTAKRIRGLAQDTGLDVVSLTYRREHPHYLKFSTPTYLAGVVIEQTVQRPIPALRP